MAIPALVTNSNPGNGTVSFAFTTPGTNYVPGSTLTCSGGTATTACQAILYSTTVASASVALPGTSCATGAFTVTGTTGVAGSTGTQYFTANVTGFGGQIVAVNSITTGGTYYQNPTNVVSEPVTGGSCVGATLVTFMGANTGAVTVAGNYTAVPSNPVGFTSAFGTGAQVNFSSSPAWYGNPLVGTISSVVNGGGNSTFNVSTAASSTITGGLGTVYLWLNDDSAGIAAAIASGKQRILFPSPPVVSGWESGYTLSTGVSIAGPHRWDFRLPR